MYICHGVFRNGDAYFRNSNRKIILPQQFFDYLDKVSTLYEQFKTITNIKFNFDVIYFLLNPITIKVPKKILDALKNTKIDVEFTLLLNNNIGTLAVVNPLDQFNRKVGVKICKIKHEMALGKMGRYGVENQKIKDINGVITDPTILYEKSIEDKIVNNIKDFINSVYNLPKSTYID